MFLRKLLILTCATGEASCLALGYVAVQAWMAVAAALLGLLIWLCAYKRPSLCPPSAALVVSVGLAAIGLWLGATSWLMLVAAVLALGSWDLVLLEHALAESSASSPETIAQFTNLHYTGLALALGSSLLIVLAGRLIHLQIPFLGMLLVIILGLVSLDRVWHMLAD